MSCENSMVVREINMLRYSWQKQRGLNMLELLMVLSVSALIIIGGVRNYQASRLQSQILEVDNHVSVLMRAMRGYWYKNCSVDISKRIVAPFTTLVTNNYLKSKEASSISNPFGSQNFDVAYNNRTVGANTVAYVEVAALLDQVDSTLAASIANQTGGVFDSTLKKVTWTRMIGMDETNSSLWILKSDLERFRKFEMGGTAPACIIQN